MKHLFDEDTDRKEALLDSKAMIEAMNELGVRIKDHLHLVVIMYVHLLWFYKKRCKIVTIS